MPKKKVAVKNKKDNKNAIILSENEKMLKDTLHNYYHKQDILFSEYDINAANLSQIWNDFQNGKLPQITECYKKVRVNEKYKFNDKDFEFLTNHLKRIYPLLDDEIISSAKATIISHHGAYQTFSSQKTRQTINNYYNEQFNTDKLDSTKFSQMWIDFQLKKIKIPTKVFPHDGLKFLQSDFKEFSDTIKQCYPEIKEEDFNKIKNNSEEHLKKIYKEIKNSSSSTGYSHNAKVEYLERYYKLLQRFNSEKGYNSNISDEQALVNILKDHCREGKELNRITPIFVSSTDPLKLQPDGTYDNTSLKSMYRQSLGELSEAFTGGTVDVARVSDEFYNDFKKDAIEYLKNKTVLNEISKINIETDDNIRTDLFNDLMESNKDAYHTEEELIALRVKECTKLGNYLKKYNGGKNPYTKKDSIKNPVALRDKAIEAYYKGKIKFDKKIDFNECLEIVTHSGVPQNTYSTYISNQEKEMKYKLCTDNLTEYLKGTPFENKSLSNIVNNDLSRNFFSKLFSADSKEYSKFEKAFQQLLSNKDRVDLKTNKDLLAEVKEFAEDYLEYKQDEIKEKLSGLTTKEEVDAKIKNGGIGFKRYQFCLAVSEGIDKLSHEFKLGVVGEKFSGINGGKHNIYNLAENLVKDDKMKIQNAISYMSCMDPKSEIIEKAMYSYHKGSLTLNGINGGQKLEIMDNKNNINYENYKKVFDYINEKMDLHIYSGKDFDQCAKLMVKEASQEVVANPAVNNKPKEPQKQEEKDLEKDIVVEQKAEVKEEVQEDQIKNDVLEEDFCEQIIIEECSNQAMNAFALEQEYKNQKVKVEQKVEQPVQENKKMTV